MAGVKLTLKRVYEDGKLCFLVPQNNEVKIALNNVLNACHEKHGDFVQVTIERPYKPRSTGPNSQNHKLNAIIHELCEETGNTYDMVKYCIKMQAVEELGYPYETMDGHILPKGEHETNTAECSKLIEAAYLLAADLHIVLKG